MCAFWREKKKEKTRTSNNQDADVTYVWELSIFSSTMTSELYYYMIIKTFRLN